jgi:hypothetical protein
LPGLRRRSLPARERKSLANINREWAKYIVEKKQRGSEPATTIVFPKSPSSGPPKIFNRSFDLCILTSGPPIISNRSSDARVDSLEEVAADRQDTDCGGGHGRWRTGGLRRRSSQAGALSCI